MTPLTTTVTPNELTLKAPTVLLIEDYSDTRQMISLLLRRRGYNVIEAEDGLEGLQRASWESPDLILMDLALPEMVGVEVTRRILAMPKLAGIPIIVLSAYLNDEVERDVRAAGCVEIFSKPFDATGFLECIRLRLERRTSEKQLEWAR